MPPLPGTGMAPLVAVNGAAIRAFAVCSTTLFLKLFITLTIQGGKSFDAGMRSPEDNQFKGDAMPTQNYGLNGGVLSDEVLAARAVDYRWKRIVQNDLETIPIGLLVLLGSVLLGGQEMVNVVVMAVFTIVRIAHTYSYAMELQPHRMVWWTIGQLCVLVGGLNGVLATFRGSRRMAKKNTDRE